MRALNNVAYIDDDADILCIAAIALEKVGKLNATLIHGPQLALEQLARAAPDLILLDVMMPGVDGPTLLQEIVRHALLSRTPVIFMTARVQPKEVDHYLALGAIGVIAKPFDPMTLSDEVRRIWDAWAQKGQSGHRPAAGLETGERASL
jgi:two-component system OmpR family response regulator